jgi:hypothetical protein
MRLEGLGQLKNAMTSSGLEPATFRLVAYYLNKLRYRVPPNCMYRQGLISLATTASRQILDPSSSYSLE